MTDFDGEAILADDELRAEFAALFPRGWAGPDVFAELTPGGWAAGPLAAVFHPSPARRFEEALRTHRALADFPRRPDAPPPEPHPEPTLAEFEADHEPSPVEPERECQELVGLCLWDVFSDNHEVTAADGRRLDLGSARAAGGFLAGVLNAQGGPPPPPKPAMPDDLMAKMFPPTDDPRVAEFVAEMRREMFGDGGYTYLDFYMGTTMLSGRADLVPVYALIFRRLRARGHDWVYHFPRLYLVDFRPAKRLLDEQRRGGEAEYAGYDPSAAFEEAQADAKKDEELAEMRANLDEAHRAAVEAASDQEPPAVVRAYAAVYGSWPQGWPPQA